jgi:hypothetical protein
LGFCVIFGQHFAFFPITYLVSSSYLALSGSDNNVGHSFGPSKTASALIFVYYFYIVSPQTEAIIAFL